MLPPSMSRVPTKGNMRGQVPPNLSHRLATLSSTCSEGPLCSGFPGLCSVLWSLVSQLSFKDGKVNNWMWSWGPFSRWPSQSRGLEQMACRGPWQPQPFGGSVNKDLQTFKALSELGYLPLSQLGCRSFVHLLPDISPDGSQVTQAFNIQKPLLTGEFKNASGTFSFPPANIAPLQSSMIKV